MDVGLVTALKKKHISISKEIIRWLYSMLETCQTWWTCWDSLMLFRLRMRRLSSSLSTVYFVNLNQLEYNVQYACVLYVPLAGARACIALRLLIYVFRAQKVLNDDHQLSCSHTATFTFRTRKRDRQTEKREEQDQLTFPWEEWRSFAVVHTYHIYIYIYIYI